MMLALTHARANSVELLRQPGYWLPSALFPALFFAFFGVRVAQELPGFIPAELGVGSEAVITQFLLFGVIGVMFFQFGVGIAEERRLPWERTLRVLPAGGAVRFVGRVATALLFSVVAMVPVMVLALATTELRLTGAEWVRWVAAVLLGAIPFGLMGITLGYATSPKAALPIANIGFLILSFVGGLFVPLEGLPAFVGRIAPFTPTRHYLDFTLGAVHAREDGAGWERPGLYLLGWAVGFGAAAVLVYRRDQGARYR